MINSSVILRVTGDRNVIEWLRFDGNVAGGALATTDCYRNSGRYNRSRDIHVVDAGGSSLVEFGYAGRMKRCTAIGGKYGLRDGGTVGFNILRDCVSLDYATKGYNNQANSVWTTVIGCYVESETNIDNADAILIDPEDLPRFGWATLRDCVSNSNHSYSGTTNGAKFAVIENVYVNGCQFLHSQPQITSMRIAEDVGRCRVKDTFLSRQFIFESNDPPYPEQARFDRVQIGDGSQTPQFSLWRALCRVLVISDSTFTKFTGAAIDWWGAESEYSMIAATNCKLSGHATGVTNDVRPNAAEGGQVNSSRRVRWFANQRENTGGGNATFIDIPIVFVGREILATTRDASIEAYEWSTTPSSTAVTWSHGDIVADTSPSSGDYYGWVCTSAGPPAVWKQFALIA